MPPSDRSQAEIDELLLDALADLIAAAAIADLDAEREAAREEAPTPERGA